MTQQNAPAAKLLDDDFLSEVSDHANFLTTTVRALAALPSLTTYADALTALIRRECENKDIAGHRFTFSYKSCANCVHELRAIDSSDGKQYTVTIQAERTP